MYIAIIGGRDSIHEFFGPCVRIDGEWLSAGYENTGPLLYLIGPGTHSWDARVVIRVPFDMVSNIKTCMASMHWLEELCAGLFHTYKHNAKSQARDIMRVQRVLSSYLPQVPDQPE